MAGKNYDINFRIKTDSSKSRKDLGMTVAEFKDFNRTVRASQTPLDRFEKDLSDLNKVFKAGGINSKQYAHRLKTLDSRYKTATGTQKKFKAGLSSVADSLKGLAIGYATFSTLSKGLSAVADQMERIDKVGKSAAGLGATTEFLSGLEFVAQRTSGLVEGSAIKAIEKMTRRLAEAAQGTGEAKVALEMLGIEAKALEGLKPERQFQILSRAMDSVTDAGKRTLIATKLFDDEQSKLHTTMALSNSEYEQQIKLAERLGKVTSQAAADQAAAYVDAMQKQKAALNKFNKALAMNSMGGLNFLSAEGQTARANVGSAFLSGDMATKADIAMGLLGAKIDKDVSATGAHKTTEAIIGRSLARAKTQVEIDEQRVKYKAEEAEAQKKYNQELNKTLEWEEMLTKEQQKQEKTDKLTDYLGRKMGQGEDVLKALGGGLGHFGLSVAGQFDRAMNAREKSEATFERIVSDPAASITAGSSEAFRLQNQQVSMMKVNEDENKKTAKNTKGTWDATEKVYDLLSNIQEIGL